MREPLSQSIIEELLQFASLNVSEIVIWRKKMRRLKDELEKQEVTEDDFIYYDLHRFIRQARYEETPLSRTFPINGVNLKVTVTHRHKAESVFGVDLVYEVSNGKIALLQYKKSNQGRFFIDREQVKKLKYFCYDDCPAKKIEKKSWFPEKSRIFSLCPCYYYLMINRKEERIMPACVVESILDSKRKIRKTRNSANTNEFRRGISRGTFMEIFSKCWLGAVYTLKENVDNMTNILLKEDHIIIHCEESERIIRK